MADQKPRQQKLTISGPGAADFLTAGGGLDTPESGGKGMAQTRGDGLLSDPTRLAPRLGPDAEAYPGERPSGQGDAGDVTGSPTGTIGGGGADAHNPSPTRAVPAKEEDQR